jgi:hypothetical protein
MKPSMSSATLRAVALGGGAGLPAMMRGIGEAFFPRGWSWVPSDDHDRLSGVCFGGNDDVGAQKLGSLILTSLNDLSRDSHWAVERVGDPSAREAIAAADLIVLGPGRTWARDRPRVRAAQRRRGRSARRGGAERSPILAPRQVPTQDSKSPRHAGLSGILTNGFSCGRIERLSVMCEGVKRNVEACPVRESPRVDPLPEPGAP